MGLVLLTKKRDCTCQATKKLAINTAGSRGRRGRTNLSGSRGGPAPKAERLWGKPAATKTREEAKSQQHNW